jgi:hypothetical protein
MKFRNIKFYKIHAEVLSCSVRLQTGGRTNELNELNWRSTGFPMALHKGKGKLVPVLDQPPRLSSYQYQYHFLPRFVYFSTFVMESVDFSENCLCQCKGYCHRVNTKLQ